MVAVLYTVAYYLVYALSVASVVGIVFSVYSASHKTGTGIGPKRLLMLAKEESARLRSRNPVLLMHLSIVLGVGLSIAIVLLDPVWQFLALLKLVLLFISLPIVVGLLAALGWRFQRLQQSKKYERDQGLDKGFSSASSTLQLVLIIAILLTTLELVLDWFGNLAILDAILNVIRNSLVIVYYSKPTVNLIRNFDRPISKFRYPFLLTDVLEGKVDASQIKVGVSKLSEFESFERLSYDSCVDIGACESACPATAAGRPLSPRILVRKLDLLEDTGNIDANPFEKIKEDELWSCTSCAACVSACPVGVRHLDVILDLRRNLVSEGKLDKEKTALLQNLAQNQNPYGFNSSSRDEWAKNQGIQTIAENPNAEYLYWVGCVSSFDQRAQNVAKSLAKILKKAEVSFAILGADEFCNGDPARRLGEEGRFQELAYQNIEKMNSYKVKKIITACPHCFNTLRNEYPILGGKYGVVHHSQLISDLIEKGKIKIQESELKDISVTLHDACYVARFNSIYDEPRKALSAARKDNREMHRHKENTFCCGAGGSNYWYKVPQQRTVSSIRTEEAKKTGASQIATECPFCLSMFEDSTRVSETNMQVRDIAEIIAEQI